MEPENLYALLGQYVAAGQELRDMVSKYVTLLQRLKDGSLTLDQVELTGDGGFKLIDFVLPSED